MLTYLRYLILIVIAALLVTVALANRDLVTLRLLPEDLAALAGFQHSIDLPLFSVIFGGVGMGILIGFVWEWVREHRYRADAAALARLKAKQQRDGGASASGPAEEIVALIDPPRKAG